MRSEMRSEVRSEIRSEMRSEVRSEMRSEVRSELRSEMRSETRSEMKSKMRSITLYSWIPFRKGSLQGRLEDKDQADCALERWIAAEAWLAAEDILNLRSSNMWRIKGRASWYVT